MSFIKSLVAVTIGVLCTPAMSLASVGAAFDAHGRNDNRCWTANNGARLCSQYLVEVPTVRTISVIHPGESHATTMFVNCENRYYEYFGNISDKQAIAITDEVC